MRNRKRVISALVAVAILLSVMAILSRWLGSPRVFTIAVTGEPGQVVRAIVTADGVTHRTNGTLPTTFEYKAKRIEYSFALAEDTSDAQITVQVSVGGVPWGSCTSSGGVQGHQRILGLAGWGSVVGDLGGLTSTATGRNTPKE